MMTFLKFVAALALFVFLGGLSKDKILHDMNFYRELATPKTGPVPVDHGPPLTAAFIEPEGPWAPSTGEERDDDSLMAEMERLLVARRVTASDAFTAFSFIPTRCMKCHEKDGPGPYFYGNEEFHQDQLFATKEGLVLRSWPLKGFAPTLKYDFMVEHAKKIPFEVGGSGDQILRIVK